MPDWERGAKNILFTANEFQKIMPDLDWDGLTLIGHSNGGDMAMLLATYHPGVAAKVISLDNRRMPLPRVKSPRIYTLRGCDYPADGGVLPTREEQEKYMIKLVEYKDIKHGDMDDKGRAVQHRAIIRDVLDFLSD